jgi:predicted HicB family RNase H-like nuclease
MEVLSMERLTLRLPDELHAKLRWLAYKERRSLNSILLEVLEKALADVKVPKEEER